MNDIVWSALFFLAAHTAAPHLCFKHTHDRPHPPITSLLIVAKTTLLTYYPRVTYPSATTPTSFTIPFPTTRTAHTPGRALPSVPAREPCSVAIVRSQPTPFACLAAGSPAVSVVAAVGGSVPAGAFGEVVDVVGIGEGGGGDGSAFVVGTGAGRVGGYGDG